MFSSWPWCNTSRLGVSHAAPPQKSCAQERKGCSRLRSRNLPNLVRHVRRLVRCPDDPPPRMPTTPLCGQRLLLLVLLLVLLLLLAVVALPLLLLLLLLLHSGTRGKAQVGGRVVGPGRGTPRICQGATCARHSLATVVGASESLALSRRVHARAGVDDSPCSRRRCRCRRRRRRRHRRQRSPARHLRRTQRLVAPECLAIRRDGGRAGRSTMAEKLP
jgi:hypothetical protein